MINDDFIIDEAQLSPKELTKSAGDGKTRAQKFAEKIESGHFFKISDKMLDRPKFENTHFIQINKDQNLIEGLKMFDGSTKIWEVPELAKFRYVADYDYKKEKKKEKGKKITEKEPTLKYLTFPATLFDENKNPIARDLIRVSLSNIFKDLADFDLDIQKDKELRIQNKGNVSEGLMACAIYLRFLNPAKEGEEKPITKEMMDNLIDNLLHVDRKDNSVSLFYEEQRPDFDGKKKDTIQIRIKLPTAAQTDLKMKDKRPNLVPEITSSIKFANSEKMNGMSREWAKNKEENRIEVKTIGTEMSDHGTTADLIVLADGKEITGSSISLKAGSTKQLGQVASNKFETIKENFFVPLFGTGKENQFREIIEKHRESYQKAFIQWEGLPPPKRKDSDAHKFLLEVFRKMYKDSYTFLKTRIDSVEKEEEFLISLGEYVYKKSHGDKEVVTAGTSLVHMNNADYKVLRLDNIAEKIAKELDIDAEFNEERIIIYLLANGKRFISFRPKFEHAAGALRQYIDKEKAIFDIFGEAKKEEEKKMETLQEMKERIRGKLLQESIEVPLEESENVKRIKGELVEYYLTDPNFLEMEKSDRINLIHSHLANEIGYGGLSIQEAKTIKREYILAENGSLEEIETHEFQTGDETPWEPEGEDIEKQYFYDILERIYKGDVSEETKMMLDVFKDKAGDPYAISNEVEEFTEMSFSLGLADSIIGAPREEILEGFEESLEEGDLKRAVFFIAAHEFGVQNKTLIAERKKRRKNRRSRFNYPYWGGGIHTGAYGDAGFGGGGMGDGGGGGE